MDIVGRAMHLFAHLEARYADDPRGAAILQVWSPTRPVQRSLVRRALAFQRGRLVVGPVCAPSDVPATQNTRLVVAAARAATTNNNCTSLTAWLLQVATTELGWLCRVDCDACYESGICTQAQCPRCEFDLDECAKKNKFVWPELVGRPAWLAYLILKELQPSKRVVMDTFDMLYQTPANADTIRIVYDARSGLVVTPPPYVTSAPEIQGPREACFLAPDGVCLGAPPNPPPAEWSGYVGRRVGEVMVALRRRYPHAAVVAIPATQIIGREFRHDRIRVRYDPVTMTVAQPPTVG